mmetsp:Transcript_10980/g.24537  ORF Transcript_10980/g.24537 Transcript_10980/m.24537 type:complete len:201 (+) Transcript_10980:517-1119(+)
MAPQLTVLPVVFPVSGRTWMGHSLPPSTAGGPSRSRRSMTLCAIEWNSIRPVWLASEKNSSCTVPTSASSTEPRSHAATEEAPVPRSICDRGNPTGGTKALASRSPRSSALSSSSGSPESSYAASSPPRQRIVVSKKETIRRESRRSEARTHSTPRANSSRIPASQSTSSESRMVSPWPIQLEEVLPSGLSSSAPHAYVT